MSVNFLNLNHTYLVIFYFEDFAERFEWSRDNSAINPELIDHNILNLKSLNKDDVDVYTCNAIGSNFAVKKSIGFDYKGNYFGLTDKLAKKILNSPVIIELYGFGKMKLYEKFKLVCLIDDFSSKVKF